MIFILRDNQVRYLSREDNLLLLEKINPTWFMICFNKECLWKSMQWLWIFLPIPLFLLQHIETMKMISMLDTEDCWSGRLLETNKWVRENKGSAPIYSNFVFLLFFFAWVFVCLMREKKGATPVYKIFAVFVCVCWSWRLLETNKWVRENKGSGPIYPNFPSAINTSHISAKE